MISRARLPSAKTRGTVVNCTSESEKISFNQLNRQTGHRIKYLKVDADSGEEVVTFVQSIASNVIAGVQHVEDERALLADQP